MIEDLMPDIRRAAAVTARNWASVIGPEDAEQEILLALVENNQVEKISDMDSEARWNALRKVGDQIGSRHRTDYDYFTGNFCYGTQDVRQALESGALSGVRDKTNTERLDVDEGLALLHSRNSRYADVIKLRYLLREPVEDRKLLTRAVDALAECMNRVHENRRNSYTEGPGTRPVISNDRAQYLSKH